MTDLVILEDCGAFGRVRINRPAQRNALNRAVRAAIADCLERARGRFRVIVITGTDTSFSAGIDMIEETADRDAGSDTAREEWIEVLLAIRRHPAIVIAAVNGFALGGGVSLINVADLAITAHEAQIGMPEIGFAAYPGMAGPTTQMSLNRKQAAWMVLTGARIDGRTAEAWGLVNRSVPLADLDAETARLANDIARFDEVALLAAKQALDTIPAQISDWAGALAFGLDLNNRIRSKTDAQLSGLKSFGDRRQSKP
jgi:enoyl-CoA hydratase/carnithine racemase